MWISVKDSVPNDNKRVFICCMDDIDNYCYPYCYEDACEVGFYEDGKWYSDTRFSILDHNGKIGLKMAVDCKNWCDIDVTHWMPLPDKPCT